MPTKGSFDLVPTKGSFNLLLFACAFVSLCFAGAAKPRCCLVEAAKLNCDFVSLCFIAFHMRTYVQRRPKDFVVARDSPRVHFISSVIGSSRVSTECPWQAHNTECVAREIHSTLDEIKSGRDGKPRRDK